MSDTVLAERRGRVGILTINRPKALNALNTEVMEAMVALGLEEETDLFDTFDTDGTGTLEFQEFFEGVTGHPRIHAIFILFSSAEALRPGIRKFLNSVSFLPTSE